MSQHDVGAAFHSTFKPYDPKKEKYEFDHVGVTVRDYFAAHAPPLPREILEERIQTLRVEYPNTALWNDVFLTGIATQERRWREKYADAMLAAREPNADPLQQPPDQTLRHEHGAKVADAEREHLAGELLGALKKAQAVIYDYLTHVQQGNAQSELGEISSAIARAEAAGVRS